MTALWIILAILILLLLLPVGVDAAFLGGVFSLAVKAGPLKIRILPAKPKKPKMKKPKKKKDKKEESAKPKQKLTLEDIKSIARLALKALSRLRRFLSIDVLELYLRVGGGDPYDTVKQYGAINAALGAALPYVHGAFKIKKQDIQTAIDFSEEKLSADAHIAATYQIWEILCIAFCVLGSLIVWLVRRKKRARAEAKAHGTDKNKKQAKAADEMDEKAENAEKKGS
ncbi:MAG: DUF2953 domain-containing protein [Butyricicoccus sp.]|nr:DUF2953 domain-containing protein [Butyricicoccus sp.]